MTDAERKAWVGAGVLIFALSVLMGIAAAFDVSVWALVGAVMEGTR